MYGFLGALVLIVSVIFFLVNNYESYQNVLKERQDRYLIALYLEQFYSHVGDAETGQRGFLLTGNAAYLTPYTDALKQINLDLHRLKNRLQESPADYAKISEIEVLTRQKLEEMAKSVAVFQQGNPQRAIEIVKSDIGHSLMEKIHVRVQALQKKQDDQIELLEVQRKQKNYDIYVISTIFGALAVMLMFVAFVLLSREIRDKNNAERNLKQLNETLELNVAERTQTLKQQLELTRSITSSLQEGIAQIDADGNISFINELACDMLGYTVEELAGQNLHSMIHHKKPDGSPFSEEECSMLQVIRDGRILKFHRDTFIKKNGTMLNVLCMASPIIVDDAKIGAILSFHDFTDIKEAQLALEESEQLFKVITQAAPIVLWLTDTQGTLTYVNQTWTDWTGQFIDQEKGHGWEQFVLPEDYQILQPQFSEAFNNHKDYNLSFRFQRLDGKIRWGISTGTPRFGITGEFQGYAGSVVDITDIKEAENSLRESEAKFRTVTEVMPQIAWAARPDGYLDFFNQRLFDYADVTHEAAEGDGWANLLHPDDVPETGKAWAHSLSTGDPYEVEFRIRNKAGDYRWFLARALPIRDEATNKIVRWFGTCTDIEDMIEARQVLARSREELEKLVEERTTLLSAVNKELEAFSYSVSHDLRSPLRSISGFSSALENKYAQRLDEEGLDYLQRIQSNASRMGQLIDDLLKLSRLNRSEITIEPVDMKDLALRVIDDLTAIEPERKIEIILGDGLQVNGDKRLLEAAIQNLIANAWKFTSKTDAPRIEFNKKDEDGQTVYYVTDNGAGFEMAYVDKLFGAFQRLHAMNEFAGTGVGLATVQRIIHRHGGKVWAYGELNKGATFYFTLTPYTKEGTESQ